MLNKKMASCKRSTCVFPKPPRRTCLVSLEQLQKLVYFFALATNNQGYMDEEDAKRDTLMPSAKERWLDLKQEYFPDRGVYRGKTREVNLPCDVAASLLPISIQKRYEPLAVLSAGDNGIALRVFNLDEDRDEVIKISLPDAQIREIINLSELQKQEKAAAWGLAPQVYELPDELTGFQWEQQLLGEVIDMEVMSMEEMAVGFDKALECATNAGRVALFGQLNAVLKTMEDLCVTHGDLHLKNIMFRHEDDGQPLLIDFARASFELFYPRIDYIQLVRGLKILTDESSCWIRPLSKRSVPSFLEALFADLDVPEEFTDPSNRHDSRKLDDLYFAEMALYKKALKAYAAGKQAGQATVYCKSRDRPSLEASPRRGSSLPRKSPTRARQSARSKPSHKISRVSMRATERQKMDERVQTRSEAAHNRRQTRSKSTKYRN
jgi:hypothetical protein